MTHQDALRIGLYTLEHALRILISFLLLVGMNGDNFSFMEELGIGAYIALWYSFLAPVAIQIQLFIKERRIIPLHEYTKHAGMMLTKAFVLYLGGAMLAYVTVNLFAPNTAQWIGDALLLPAFTSIMGEMAGFAFIILPAGIAHKEKKT